MSGFIKGGTYRQRVKPPRVSEAQIQEACVDLLEHDGWRRLRTDPVSDRSTVNAIRARIMAMPALNHVREIIFKILASCTKGKGFGEPGMPDDLFIRYHARPGVKCPEPGAVHDGTAGRIIAQVMWIEWKAADGAAAAHQLAWHQAEKVRGALVLLAGKDFPCTIDGFQRWYTHESGLARNIRK